MDQTWIENLVSVTALLIALEVRTQLARRYGSLDRRPNGDNGES